MPQTTLEEDLESIYWHIEVLHERIKNGKGNKNNVSGISVSGGEDLHWKGSHR